MLAHLPCRRLPPPGCGGVRRESLGAADLARTIPADDLALWALERRTAAVGSVLEDAFRGNITTLPAQTRQPSHLSVSRLRNGEAHLRLAAADLVWTIWTRRGGRADRLQPRTTGVRHPLIRAAAYRLPRRRTPSGHLTRPTCSSRRRGAAFERRRRASGRRGTAADESLASTFQATADQELATGNFTVAGKLYQRSADLTPDPNIAMRRMLSAANALRLAGAIDESRGLLADAASRGDDPDLLAAIGYALCRLEVYRGAMVQGRDGLLEIGIAAATRSPAQAADILSDAALASTVIGDMETARTSAQRAVALVAKPESSPPPLQVAAVSAMVSALSGDPVQARALLAPRTAEIDTVDPLGIDFIYQGPSN